MGCSPNISRVQNMIYNSLRHSYSGADVRMSCVVNTLFINAVLEDPSVLQRQRRGPAVVKAGFDDDILCIPIHPQLRTTLHDLKGGGRAEEEEKYYQEQSTALASSALSQLFESVISVETRVS